MAEQNQKKMNWSNYGKWRHPNQWNKLNIKNKSSMKQKFEKVLEWIGYGFIAVVSVLVLSTAFTLLWQFSKSIYKVLSK